MSLLEILFSLLILGYAIASLSHLLNTGIQASLRHKYEVDGLQQCQQKLDELLSGSLNLIPVQCQPLADHTRACWSLDVDQTGNRETVIATVTVTYEVAALGPVRSTMKRVIRPAASAKSAQPTKVTQ